MSRNEIVYSAVCICDNCHYFQFSSRPNSYRVISVDAESIDFERSGFLPPLHSKTESNVIGQGPSGNRPAYGYRSNRPNPTNVNFLRHDVALLNEPVCNVYTSATHNNQANWWPHQSSTEPHAPAPYTFNTTVREDFQYHGAGVKRSTRHSCNPDKQPALGSGTKYNCFGEYSF